MAFVMSFIYIYIPYMHVSKMLIDFSCLLSQTTHTHEDFNDTGETAMTMTWFVICVCIMFTRAMVRLKHSLGSLFSAEQEIIFISAEPIWKSSTSTNFPPSNITNFNLFKDDGLNLSKQPELRHFDLQ